MFQAIAVHFNCTIVKLGIIVRMMVGYNKSILIAFCENSKWNIRSIISTSLALNFNLKFALAT